MKVLVADKFEPSGIDGLKAAGCEVLYQPDLKDDALRTAIRDSGADVLVVRGTNVTGPMLEAGSLSLIVRAGAGAPGQRLLARPAEAGILFRQHGAWRSRRLRRAREGGQGTADPRRARRVCRRAEGRDRRVQGFDRVAVERLRHAPLLRVHP